MQTITTTIANEIPKTVITYSSASNADLPVVRQDLRFEQAPLVLRDKSVPALTQYFESLASSASKPVLTWTQPKVVLDRINVHDVPVVSKPVITKSILNDSVVSNDELNKTLVNIESPKAVNLRKTVSFKQTQPVVPYQTRSGRAVKPVNRYT